MDNKKEYQAFVRHEFENRKKVILIIGVLICFFELFFFIRGLASFRNEWYRLGYLICYGVLTLATIVCVSLTFLTRKAKKYDSILTGIISFYGALVFIWSIAVSTIDAIRGNYPVVFMIVASAVPFFLVYHYSQNLVGIGVGTISVIVGSNSYFVSLGQKMGLGYLSNILVFSIISGAISILCYQQNMKRYNLENILKEASTHDGLTKLYNRSALDNRLEALTKEEFHNTVVMLDCDNFKKFNDKYGHRFGDEALVKISQLIKVKFGDDSYRYGGDEFIIITRLKDDKIISRIKEINNGLATHFENYGVSVTAGIYHVESGATESTIISKVDSALYKAKNEQRGSYHIYEVN